MLTDPIADMLTRIRNANMVGKDWVLIPGSKTKLAIGKILKEEGFIEDFELLKDTTPQRVLKLKLKYTAKKEPVLKGLERVSKPGRRVYVGRGEIPRIFGGLGVVIISTSQGIMTGRGAWRRGIGGEILCYVW